MYYGGDQSRTATGELNRLDKSGPSSFRLPPYDKDARREFLCWRRTDRRHIIRFKVEQNSATLYWQARGVIELIEAKRFALLL
jgi:hypothetical protein